MSAQLEELAFQLWMRFGGRSFCATEENLRKNWQSLHSTPYWLKQAAELQALGVGVREAEPPRRNVDAQLEHLATLPANWDSYGAPPITREALEAARLWLAGLWIWPRSSGGLTLGRDEAGQDVRIGPDGVFESDEDEPPPPGPLSHELEIARQMLDWALPWAKDACLRQPNLYPHAAIYLARAESFLAELNELAGVGLRESPE